MVWLNYKGHRVKSLDKNSFRYEAKMQLLVL